MTASSTTGLAYAGVWWDPQVVATTLPVDMATNSFRTVLRLALPVLPGDVLDIYADARVTNDVGREALTDRRYIVGIGYSLWAYNASAPSGAIRDATWKQIDSPMGENVTPDVHHLALNIGRVLRVPATWVPGDQMGIALRADAHSTGWATNGGGEAITVDPYGTLIVRRWTTPEPAPEEPA